MTVHGNAHTHTRTSRARDTSAYTPTGSCTVPQPDATTPAGAGGVRCLQAREWQHKDRRLPGCLAADSSARSMCWLSLFLLLFPPTLFFCLFPQSSSPLLSFLIIQFILPPQISVFFKLSSFSSLAFLLSQLFPIAPYWPPEPPPCRVTPYAHLILLHLTFSFYTSLNCSSSTFHHARKNEQECVVNTLKALCHLSQSAVHNADLLLEKLSTIISISRALKMNRLT